MSEVLLVRHGATEWSETGRHTSVTDLPLTEAGRTAADAVGRWLTHRIGSDPVVVLCSPRLRARETCELSGWGGAARLEPDLAEWAYGDYEGLTTPEIRRRDPGWTIFERGAPGGESVEAVQERADRVVDLLRAPGRSVLAFGHGHFLRVVAARWVGLDAGWGRALKLDPGAIGALGRERETPAIGLWNLRPSD